MDYRHLLIESIRQCAPQADSPEREMYDAALQSNWLNDFFDWSISQLEKQDVPNLPGYGEPRESIIRMAYRGVLGREISVDELETRLSNYKGCANLITEFMQSDEFATNNLVDEKNRAEFIKQVFSAILGREIDSQELVQRLQLWQPPARLVMELIQSEEFRHKKSISREVSDVQDKSINQYRKEFIEFIFKKLLQRNIGVSELEERVQGSQALQDMVRELLLSEEYRQKQKAEKIDLSEFLGESFFVLGETLPIDANRLLHWHRKAGELLSTVNLTKTELPSEPAAPTDAYDVLLLTSLYKGSRYIESFLQSITSQKGFRNCLLYIVDANSPENEYECIRKYEERFPNIQYERFNETIGIYTAWNHAIKSTQTPYICSVNVDDLHRADAIDKKLNALEENTEFDVVYSDVFYSFIPNVPFEIFSQCGVRTNLPTVNRKNLIEFNSPHNSPLWRRSLHDKLGLFNEGYLSAGDHEFWLRAAFAGSRFLKIDEAVTGYLHNTSGMSTRSDSPGIAEGQLIVDQYTQLTQKY